MTKLATLIDENPQVQTFLLLIQLGDAVIKYMDYRFYHELRTSYIKYFVLKALVLNDGIMKRTELANWTNTKKHNITALVDRMTKEKLVTSEWSTTDRRVNNVIITDKGRELYNKAEPLSIQMIKKLMQGLKEDDLKKFERLLEIPKRNVESI